MKKNIPRKTIAEQLKDSEKLKKQLVQLKENKRTDLSKRISVLEKQIKEKDELIESLREEKQKLSKERELVEEIDQYDIWNF